MLNFIVNKIMVNKKTGDYVIDLVITSAQIEVILSLAKQDIENINKAIKEVLG